MDISSQKEKEKKKKEPREYGAFLVYAQRPW